MKGVKEMSININYSLMTNEELNKLSATTLMMEVDGWDPTNRISGQIWKILHIMSDMGFDWKIAHKSKRKDLPDCCFIYIYKEDDLINTVLSVRREELNRDILICCLLVLDNPTPLITPETYYCEFCFGDIDINDKGTDKLDGETYSHKNCNASTSEGEN